MLCVWATFYGFTKSIVMPDTILLPFQLPGGRRPRPMGGTDSVLSRASRGAHDASLYGDVERSASREVKYGVEFKTSRTELLHDTTACVCTIVVSRTYINGSTIAEIDIVSERYSSEAGLHTPDHTSPRMPLPTSTFSYHLRQVHQLTLHRIFVIWFRNLRFLLGTIGFSPVRTIEMDNLLELSRME
jgi:hypothetical protein